MTDEFVVVVGFQGLAVKALGVEFGGVLTTRCPGLRASHHPLSSSVFSAFPKVGGLGFRVSGLGSGVWA